MEEPQVRNSSFPLYAAAALFLLGVLLLAAWNTRLPYLAFSSGPVSDASDTIVAEDVDLYPPEGELLMLTVSNQDVNIFEALIAGVDPTVDLVRREAYRRPDESDEDYRNRVLAQMEDSQQVSIAVALDYLGYEMLVSDVVVIDVLPDKPAADALQPGDLLLTFNGQAISRNEDLSEALSGLSPGQVVTIEIERDSEPMTLEVEMAEREDEPGAPLIGVTVHEIAEPPFPLSIEAGAVGGPSAGMMHTLAIIDVLTPGEMTMGQIVAGTGTIARDGSVGRIGGIRQKVVGAEAAGAHYILVPHGNYEEALTAERESIEIVPVENLVEALAFFEQLPDPNV